jgi:hypothetical protein
MKIKNILIDLHTQYANEASFIVVIDEHPKWQDLKYTTNRKGLYFGCNADGFVNFFSYTKPGNGYGRTNFNITMQDGTKETLIGPWSSRAGVMNKAGFPECIDVTYQDWRGSKQHGALLVSELAKHTGLYKSKETSNGEYIFVPKI